ncbi:MAG: glycosyltransferase family 25 protein [bacterium]|nr:glycosyltransferase family 25 protein [Rhodospirillaceae bacterium]MDE0242486.1 glycosyltransferase family 25 protein [bacterium]MDE0418489.1 glycosyltransferase family 25 protein [bacterium]
MSLPVFVINLDRRPDRWRVVSANLDRIGLHATRIDAIDGFALTDDVAALRLMGPGHVGCARSHYKAYSALLESRYPAALILEDDVELGASVPAIIRSGAWWPDGHGTVKLTSPADAETRYCMGHSVGQTPCGRALRPILRKSLGAYGYLINRGTAELILETMPEIPVPIDHMLFNMVDSTIARTARPLQMMPAAIRHRPYELVGSDTGSAQNRLLKNALGRKPWKENEVVRLYRKTSWAWAVLTGGARFLRVPYKD